VHLTRSFRAHLGCTPGELLRRHRLERAAGLLTATDLPLVEIALSLGFPDQTNFTHRFGESYGAPPGAYRRLTRRGRRTFV
jgi:AraC family transcriptional regulator